MEEQRLEWVAHDEWDTKHSMSITKATEILKELFDDWPDGLDEMKSSYKSLLRQAREKNSASTQVIQDLTALYKKTVKSPIYVLTEEYNEYDQYGEYFIHAWKVKPTREELLKYVHAGNVEDVLDGGGRRNGEDRWYHLKEVVDA